MLAQNLFASIFCSRPQNYAWFLGAGASRVAGLPTAADIIWDMKRRYYCLEENQDITRQDIQNEAVKDRIQSFMDARGFPALWADDEYSIYFEKIFGSDSERQRKYLKAILSEEKVTLSVGNRVLGALLASELCKIVFTTNFDSVVEKAVAEVSGKSLSAYHLEGSRAANEALNNEEFPLYCKLHGDFRYDSLKNLSEDLATQNDDLAQCLVTAGNRFGFVVTGYSGRDESVMSMFRSVLTSHNPFPHGFFWTGIKGSDISPRVEKLLEDACDKGVNAQYVEIETFDTLMLRLWRNIENKCADIDSKVRKTQIASVHIPLSAIGTSKPIMRLNALPVTSWPTKCHVLSFDKPKEWADLRAAQRNTENGLILTKSESIWCWGTKTTISEEFGGQLSSVETYDLSQKIVNLHENLHFKGFLEEALCAALVREKPLLARTTRASAFLIADRHSEDQSLFDPLFQVVGKFHGEISGLFAPTDEHHRELEQVSWAEAVRVSIDIKDGKFWLLLDPDIWIWPNRARRVAVDFMDRRRSDRYNKVFNELINAWISIVLGTSERNAEIAVSAFDEGSEAENPSFKIATRTAFTHRLVS